MLLSWYFRVPLSDLSLLEILLNSVTFYWRRRAWDCVLDHARKPECFVSAQPGPLNKARFSRCGVTKRGFQLCFFQVFLLDSGKLSASLLCHCYQTLLIWSMLCSKLGVLPEVLDFSRSKTRPTSQASARGTLGFVAVSSLSNQEN